jgi:hypothetical protein
MTDFFNGVDQTANVTSIQNADQAKATQATPEPALIGEGKKYRDILTADKALADKDAFIAKLQEENANYKGAVTKLSTMEEALKRLEAKNMQTANSEPTTPVPVANSASTQTFDQNKIEEMVKAQVSSIEQNRIQESNRLQVANKLTTVFGDTQRANEIIDRKARELGVDRSYFEQQARIAPAAVLKLLIPEGSNVPTNGILPGTSINTNQEPTEYNPVNDPILKQFGKPTADGKGFVLKDAKAWERHIASKKGIKL